MLRLSLVPVVCRQDGGARGSTEGARHGTEPGARERQTAETRVVPWPTARVAARGAGLRRDSPSSVSLAIVIGSVVVACLTVLFAVVAVRRAASPGRRAHRRRGAAPGLTACRTRCASSPRPSRTPRLRAPGSVRRRGDRARLRRCRRAARSPRSPRCRASRALCSRRSGRRPRGLERREPVVASEVGGRGHRRCPRTSACARSRSSTAPSSRGPARVRASLRARSCRYGSRVPASERSAAFSRSPSDRLGPSTAGEHRAARRGEPRRRSGTRGASPRRATSPTSTRWRSSTTAAYFRELLELRGRSRAALPPPPVAARARRRRLQRAERPHSDGSAPMPSSSSWRASCGRPCGRLTSRAGSRRTSSA